MRRAGRLVLVALAGWPLAAAPAAVTEPELAAPDPVAAIDVPIRGATDAERAAALASIAAVPDAGVRAVVFFDQGDGVRCGSCWLADPCDRTPTPARSGWRRWSRAGSPARCRPAPRPIGWLELASGGGGFTNRSFVSIR